MKLVRFEDEYGMETYVNADQVTHIRAIGESSVIHFGSDKHTVTVKMSASTVASALTSTGKPEPRIGLPPTNTLNTEPELQSRF